MNVLISGGSKSGKSAFAERLAGKLAAGGPLYYVATMIPFDGEDRQRIERHRKEREGLGFVTIEQGRDIASVLKQAQPNATFLVDSLTALFMNEQFPRSFDEPADPDAACRALDGLLQVAGQAKNAVFVSDYIYAEAARYSEYTEQFRAGLAFLDRGLAGAADEVIELCAGNPVYHKGGPAV